MAFGATADGIEGQGHRKLALALPNRLSPRPRFALAGLLGSIHRRFKYSRIASATSS
jgi:hypothetical protein